AGGPGPAGPQPAGAGLAERVAAALQPLGEALVDTARRLGAEVARATLRGLPAAAGAARRLAANAADVGARWTVRGAGTLLTAGRAVGGAGAAAFLRAYGTAAEAGVAGVGEMRRYAAGVGQQAVRDALARLQEGAGWVGGGAAQVMGGMGNLLAAAAGAALEIAEARLAAAAVAARNVGEFEQATREVRAFLADHLLRVGMETQAAALAGGDAAVQALGRLMADPATYMPGAGGAFQRLREGTGVTAETLEAAFNGVRAWGGQALGGDAAQWALGGGLGGPAPGQLITTAGEAAQEAAAEGAAPAPAPAARQRGARVRGRVGAAELAGLGLREGETAGGRRQAFINALAPLLAMVRQERNLPRAFGARGRGPRGQPPAPEQQQQQQEAQEPTATDVQAAMLRQFGGPENPVHVIEHPDGRLQIGPMIWAAQVDPEEAAQDLVYQMTGGGGRERTR
ncbi:MAG: hypothetical protein KDK70_36810, partial [Myxococcales bacterium]|nr:hypothetical protein [Myxococcales bacterium]